MLEAQRKIRSRMDQLDVRIQKNGVILSDIPRIEALPQAEIPADDISSIAEKYKNIDFSKSKPQGLPDLFVLISFSMPEGAIEKLIVQAEKSGAILVFQGLKGDSMSVMGKAVEKIVKGRNVQVVIHPPAFQQFSVKQVPAFVLAKQEAEKLMDDGCATPQSFIKISGDVTLDYALEYIERHNQEWSAIARSYHSRIKQEL